MLKYRNYDIYRVTSLAMLEDFFDDGLAELYSTVFAEPPFNEDISDKEAREGFSECFKAGGVIFVGKDPQTGRVISFITSQSVASSETLPESLRQGTDISYLAEDGVAEAYRKQGISSFMKQCLLEANRNLGFRYMVVRTNVRNYPEINGFSKAGGVALRDVFQNVASKRQDGSISNDKRSFYVFDLNSNDSDYDYVEKVLIKSDGSDQDDVVFVNGSGLTAAQSQELFAQIKTMYPAVESVVFLKEDPKCMDVNALYCGGLYVPRKSAVLSDFVPGP